MEVRAVDVEGGTMQVIRLSDSEPSDTTAEQGVRLSRGQIQTLLNARRALEKRK